MNTISNNYFEHILDMVPESIYWLDREGRHIGCNRATAKSFNVPKERIFGKTNKEISLIPESRIDLDTVQVWDRVNQEVISSGKIIIEKAPGPNIDGKIPICWSKKIPLEDKWGNTIGVLGISVKIDQKKELKNLEEDTNSYIASVQYYENIIDKLPVEIFWHDHKGRYLGCNSMRLEQLGIENKEDVLGKTNMDLSKIYGAEIFPFPVEEKERENQRVISSGIAETREYIINKNGQQKTYLSSKTPLKDNLDKTIGLLGVALDITEQKKIQELNAAKEKLDIANKIKSEFLANMSHEMRTPLNIIYGQMQLILEAELEIEKKEIYRLILNNCHTMMNLMDDIMDVGKLEENKLKIKKTDFNLVELMNEIYLEYCVHNSKTVKLVLDIPQAHNLLFIRTDRIRIKQILVNLLTNAYKATQKGLITLGIYKTEDRLYFYVKDTGIGIKSSDQHKIFQRFTKLHTNIPGTGIGLNIVKGLLEFLGGDITFQSEEGKGSKFSFHIPYVPAKKTKNSEEKTPETGWKNKTILLVEDTNENAMILEKYLTLNHAQVVWVKDGQSAIEIFQKTPTIDLVLLDIGLPDIDGFEVLNHIREIDQDIPVIAQTAHSMIHERDVFTSLGFNDFILKPIPMQLLRDVINKQFD